MNKTNKKQKGITLIALVITIVILLILAGISINMLSGKDGILNRAKDAREKNDIATDIETIKMEYLEFLIEISPETATINKFLEYLENDKGYFVDYGDENGDENVELNGRLYTVKLEGKELIVEYFKKATVNSKNLPKITNLNVVVDKNSVEVTVALDKKEEITIKYVIAKEDGTIVKEVNADGSLNKKFNDLDANTIYTITVEVTNQYGTRKRKATIKTLSLVELTEGKANFKITPNTQWQKEVIATIESSYENQTATLQYRIGSNGEWKDYTIDGFKVDENTSIFGRFYNKTTEEVGYAFTDKVTIIDDGDPNGSIELSRTAVGLNSASVATVTLTDSQSGIDFTKSKYIINSSATALGTSKNKYTGGSITKSPQTVDIKSGTTGKYYLHVLAIDKVGKAVEFISNAVSVENRLEIYTPDDLQNISVADGTYYIMKDIDMTGYNYATNGITFSGILDGQGHTISNLHVTQCCGGERCGLFKELSGATIRNLLLKDALVDTSCRYAGVIAGGERIIKQYL